MRRLIVLVAICICMALFASADDGHKTTVRVTPGILSKLLGSKPTSITLDGNKKQKKPTAFLSYYPTLLADYPSEQYPGKKTQKDEEKPNKDPIKDPYTFLPQRPIYPPPRPYPSPYPYPVPVSYPQQPSLPPQIPPPIQPYPQYPYPQYPGYPSMYPGYFPSSFPVYPNYPPPLFPYPYPSKYPPYPYPGYPFLAEPGDESGPTAASASQTPDEVGEIVTNPELAGEPDGDDANDIDDYVRQPKPVPVPVAMPSSKPLTASPMPVPSSVPMPSSMLIPMTLGQ